MGEAQGKTEKGKFWFNNLSVGYSETFYLECESCRGEMYCRPPMGDDDEDKILLIQPHQCDGGNNE